MKGTIISLFDVSAVAVKPWAEAGFECYCFDLLNKDTVTVYSNGGAIFKIEADLDLGAGGWKYVDHVAKTAPAGSKIMLSFPPCDDLAVSGARHFAKKAEADPLFQHRAAARATESARLAVENGFSYVIENPVGRLSTLWRKPDIVWSPHEFGGYLPEDDVHPEWPKYIAPRDAYTKKTGAWIGGDIVWPEKKPVEPEIIEKVTKSGRTLRGSRQFFMLGGKSAKTKRIRDVTPRGWSKAFFLANSA